MRVQRLASWPVIAFALSIGVSLLLSGLFNAAYLFFAVAGLAIGALWFKHLEGPYPSRWKHTVCKYGGCLVITMGTTLLILWGHRRQISLELERTEGLLVPANEPTPTVCFDMPLPDGILGLYLGGGRLHTPFFFPFSPVVLQDDTPVITVDRDTEGNISLTLDVLDRDNKVVARIKRNEFVVNVNNVLRIMRPDRHTLVVEDQEGQEVLNVRYLNREAIQLKAVLFVPGSNGKPVTINDDGVDVGGAYWLGIRCASYSPSMAGQFVLPSF